MLENYDFQAAQELMYNKEVLNQEERDMCMQLMPKMAVNNTIDMTKYSVESVSKVLFPKKDGAA